MNTNRRGKIARLPRETRQELNRRIADGEPGGPLLAWLNARPEVRDALAAQFGGRAVSQGNLSEWRQGGYRDWLHQQAAMEMAAHLDEEAQAWYDKDRAPLTETLSFWLAARYAAATRRIAEADDPKSWRLMRAMCRDVVQLRRGDQLARRLDLEDEKQDRARELLELERARTRRKTEAEFEEWASNPENLARLKRKRQLRRDQIQELRRRAWGPVPDDLDHLDPEGAAYKWKLRVKEAAATAEAAVQKVVEAGEQAEKWEAAAKASRAKRGVVEEEEDEEQEDEAEAEDAMARDEADEVAESSMENGPMENGGSSEAEMEDEGGVALAESCDDAPDGPSSKIERSAPDAAQAGQSLQTAASAGAVGRISGPARPARSHRGNPA